MNYSGIFQMCGMTWPNLLTKYHSGLPTQSALVAETVCPLRPRCNHVCVHGLCSGIF